MSTITQRSLFEAPPRAVPGSLGQAAVRTIETENLLTPGQGRTADYDFTLNPYRGCTFGCSYCYAAFFVPDPAQRAAWGEWVEVKVRAVDALRHRDLRGKSIYMSSVTDPYQPIEAKIELTRDIVSVLADAEARLVVQTRSPLVARDIDLFSRFKNIRINMSITTDDDEVRQQFEPGCASIGRRLEAVARLKDAGLPVAVCVCPMLPMHDPEGFGRRMRKLGVDAISASWFHMNDKPFAAGTRDPALELIEATGWRYEKFLKCRDALYRGWGVGSRRSAFAPA